MKPRDPKVYGITTGHARLIVAAQNYRHAAGLIGVSLGDLKRYGCPTGNEVEIEIGLGSPGTVFARFGGYSEPYQAIRPGVGHRVTPRDVLLHGRPREASDGR